jgi:multiple sugar transport system permease protein
VSSVELQSAAALGRSSGAGWGRRISRAIVYIVLIAGAVAMITPLAWLIRSSLMGEGQMFLFPPQWIPNPFEWNNYSGALSAEPFLTYFLNTMTIEVGVVPGVLITSGLAAYAFARMKWRGRNFWFAMVIATMMLPYAVTLIPTFIMWKYLGGINTFAPLIVPAWFGGGAFNIFLLRQFFLTVPKELDEAAFMDGATPWTIFWRILVPLSKPAFIAVGIFTFIGVWNDFLNPIIYLNDPSKYTLALGLAQFQGEMYSQWGYLMAASTVVIAPIIILFFALQRYFIQGIAMTGLKG